MRYPNMRSLSSVATAFFAITGAGAAVAASAAQSDAQCVVLTNAVSKTPQNENGQRALLATHFFFLGRLDAEVSRSALPATIADAAKSLVPGLAGKQMVGCETAAQAAETAVQQAGRLLQATPAK